MRFKSAYASCPVCSPTRAALLSGRYPELVGVPGVIRETTPRDNWGYLAPGTVLLPELLTRVGYHTALLGKWHLGSTPENRPVARGFQQFVGIIEGMVNDYYKFSMYGASERVDLWRNSQPMAPTGEHATDLFTREAVKYIKARSKKSTPFFLYLSYNAPHTPIQPPPDWLEKVRKRAPDLGEKRSKLVALIEHLDAAVGRVMAAVRQSGIERRTLVVFTSDNGGQLNVGADNGPLRGGKGCMYEGGLRVPLGISWPGRVKAGSTSDQVVLSMDLFPTLLRAAGITPSRSIDGMDVTSTLLGAKQPLSRDLFWTRREGGDWCMGQTIWAFRRGHWKLLQTRPQSPFELYDLAADPNEQNDVRKKRPKVYREMAAGLRAHLQRGGAVPWQKR
jgi:arylsulfatase A-like enzyme